MDEQAVIKSLNDKGFPVYVYVGPSRYKYDLDGEGFNIEGLAEIDRTFCSYTDYQINTLVADDNAIISHARKFD